MAVKLTDLTSSRKLETKSFLNEYVLSWPKASDDYFIVPTTGLDLDKANLINRGITRAIEIGALITTTSRSTIHIRKSDTSFVGIMVPAHVKITYLGETILEWKPEEEEKDNNEEEIITVKPTFYGIGIDLKKAWKKMMTWFKTK